MIDTDDRPEIACAFCSIAAGERQPGVIAHSNRDAVAFPAMHQRPRNQGHTLVVTRRHVTDLTALDADSHVGVMEMLVTVAAALQRDGAAGTTVIQHNGAAGGQDTFHLHFHVVSRHPDDGFYRDPLPWPRGLELVPEDRLLEQAARLRAIIRPGAEWFRPATVHVVDYDPAWPDAFETEASDLRTVLGELIDRIEHVGSTAVPGCAAKPIIDILVGVKDWSMFDTTNARLQSLGYLYTPHSEQDDPGRRVFRKGSTDFDQPRTHHLHLTLTDSDYWRRLLHFRDRLRSDPPLASRYVDLKRQLASDYHQDQRRYTKGKTQFVTAIDSALDT